MKSLVHSLLECWNLDAKLNCSFKIQCVYIASLVMHKPLYGNQELLKLNQGYVIQITSKIECSTPHTTVFFSIIYNTTVMHKILMDTDSSNI